MDAVSPKNKQSSKRLGDEAEILALTYLQTQGLRPVQCNFSCKFGEIDLIMQDNNSLVFVEVRYRKHQSYGSGAESIDFRKQQKILKTAEFFLQQRVKYNQLPCRIDVVSIGPKNSEINWIKNAFGA